MNSSLSDIKNMLRQMTPEEQQEALAALRLSSLQARKENAELSGKEEYSIAETEYYYGRSMRRKAPVQSYVGISGISLMSLSQFKAFREQIVPIADPWWLLDSIDNGQREYAHYVVMPMNKTVEFFPGKAGMQFGVRPLLYLERNHGMRIGDVFPVGKTEFRMIADNMALCEQALFNELFPFHYQGSILRKNLTSWLYRNTLVWWNTKSPLLGQYRQGALGESMPIEWIVLKKEQGRKLLISKFILERKHFDEKINEYRDSSLRKWLNQDFYDEAFSEAEKESIVPAGIGELLSDQDKVFILSSQEAERLVADTDRIGFNTMYVRATYRQSGDGPAHWWCRDRYGSAPRFVGKDGRIFNTSCYVETTRFNYQKGWNESLPQAIYHNGGLKGVRPCIWISTE